MTLIIGNWKMNGLAAQLGEIATLNQELGKMASKNFKAVICPPATLIRPACAKAGDNVLIGGQNCHADVSGAHTGDISAQMLQDAGAKYVIVGHSERRADCGETNEQVKAKAIAALNANITPIICVGESEAERKSGNAIEIVLQQLKQSLPDKLAKDEIVVAYEPVWAIGTGLVPSIEDITQMHQAIRQALAEKLAKYGEKTPILYGGSMKAANSAQILEIAHVNGGLIGGASLKASDFLAIIKTVK